MDHLLTESGIRVIGVLGFVFIGYSIFMGRLTAQGLPAGYTNPVLALELVTSGADIRQIVEAESGKAAKFIRKSTSKDFGFIIVYAVFFVALSLLLSQISLGRAAFIAWFAAGSAILAAILDFAEDWGMLKALGGEHSDSLADSIRYASLAKWSLLFFFSLLVGLFFSGRWNLFTIPAAFFLLAALLGLSGVILNFFRPKYYWTFIIAPLSMGVAVMFLAIAFTFWPARFLDELTG
jgi:hypothetical protein